MDGRSADARSPANVAGAMLGLSLLVACASRSSTPALVSDQGASQCDSMPDAISPDQSLEALAGRYRLTLVKTKGVSKPPGSFVGWLYLWRTSERDSSVRTNQRAIPGDTTRNPYFGTTDVDLDAAEAYAGEPWRGSEAPTRDEIDPVFPPILGHVTRGMYQGRPWLDFDLAVGSIGNRRDGSLGLDGAGIGLFVRRLDATGLFGYWEPYGIVETGRGYFCAVRG
jgi:hypothetical protein